MKKKILIGSIFAVALLTLVSFSSVVGYNVVKNTQDEIITSEYDFEYCKDYLFETMVEISNNEDVKDLTSSNNQNMFPTNFNQRTLFPVRRNTNKLSVEKLDLLYNIGIKLIDRLGEEKVAEIMETTNIEKPDFSDELFTTIMGNDDLRDRIYTLSEMNVESETLDDEFPIICGIIKIIFEPISIFFEILYRIMGTPNPFILITLFVFLYYGITYNLMLIVLSPLYLLDEILNCSVIPP